MFFIEAINEMSAIAPATTVNEIDTIRNFRFSMGVKGFSTESSGAWIEIIAADNRSAKSGAYKLPSIVHILMDRFTTNKDAVVKIVHRSSLFACVPPA